MARVVLVVALASVLTNTVLLATTHLAGELPSGPEVLILVVASVLGSLLLTRGLRRQLRVPDSAHAS